MGLDGPPAACAVVLAAGMGTRMRSKRPKVLHELCGRPMITHLLRALTRAGVERLVIVVGPGMEELEAAVRSAADIPVEFVVQRERLGTGHAVQQATATLEGEERPVLVTYGDTVLYRAETLSALLQQHAALRPSATVLTAEVSDSTGYGRVVRDEAGQVRRIVEQKDATPREAAINEINTGTYVFEPAILLDCLARLSPKNSQGEYYLTDVISLLTEAGRSVEAVRCSDPDEALGVNDRLQLAQAESILQERIRRHWLAEGVTLVDPGSTLIDADVVIGADTTIEPFTVLAGETEIGFRCKIGPKARLMAAKIGDGARVVQSDVCGFRVGEGVQIGPNAALGVDE